MEFLFIYKMVSIVKGGCPERGKGDFVTVPGGFSAVFIYFWDGTS
jgi:hypothetical protein